MANKAETVEDARDVLLVSIATSMQMVMLDLLTDSRLKRNERERLENQIHTLSDDGCNLLELLTKRRDAADRLRRTSLDGRALHPPKLYKEPR